MGEMPVLNLDTLNLTAEESLIAKQIISTQGKNKGRLRASKPKMDEIVVTNDRGHRVRKAINGTGEAAYLWRMVAFQISPIGQHKCMPVMAFCDLPQDDHDERRAVEKRLNDLADRIAKTVPLHKHHGTLAWGRAFGVL